MDSTLKRILVEKGFVTQEQLAQAEKESARLRLPLEDFLVTNNLVSKKQLGNALSIRYGLLYFDSDLIRSLLQDKGIGSGEDLAKLVNKPLTELASVMRTYKMLPLDSRNGSYRIVIVPPMSEMQVAQIQAYLGGPLEVVLTTEQDYNEVLRTTLLNFGLSKDEPVIKRKKEIQIQSTDLITAEATPQGVLNSLLLEAVTQGATDLHFVADENRYKVRYRIDGILLDVHDLPFNLGEGIVARVKVLAEMDIAEKRKPQDGQMEIVIENYPLSVRVATVGSNYGENLFLRILYKRKFDSSLDELGMIPEQVDIVRKSVSKPYGIIVTTGPTGSGKTTTLYAMIREILTYGLKNIITIEDPVEYDFGGITQIQVNPKAEITFASVLRAVMREDPDVILVGEIRDAETLHTAISAALSGHLVLSTLHANNAVSAVARMLSMGADPVLLASALTTVMAQRLMRLWDKRSREYKGRIGVFEVLPITGDLQSLISQKADIVQLEAASRSVMGFKTMEEVAKRLVADGVTTTEEYHRVFGYNWFDTSDSVLMSDLESQLGLEGAEIQWPK